MGPKENCGNFFSIWDSMLRRYRAYLVPPALRRKGAVIDGSLRKGGSRDLTMCSTPAPFLFLSGAVSLPICFMFVNLRTAFQFESNDDIKIAPVVVLRYSSCYATKIKLILFFPLHFELLSSCESFSYNEELTRKAAKRLTQRDFIHPLFCVVSPYYFAPILTSLCGCTKPPRT